MLSELSVLIEKQGMREFSLRKLAQQTGVSHAAPYRHFKNREELLVTLAMEGHRRLRLVLLDVRVGGKGTAADRYIAMSRAYLDFARKNPDYLRVMFSRESMQAAMSMTVPPDFHSEDYDSYRVLHAMIRDCQAEGCLDPTCDPDALSMLAWSQVHGLALLRNEGLLEIMSQMHGGTEQRTLDLIFDLVRAGLTKARRGEERAS